MNRIHIRNGVEEEYKGDLMVIRAAFENEGLDISDHEAYELWRSFSDSMAAGWMGLNNYTMEQIVLNCRPYFEEVEMEEEES